MIVALSLAWLDMVYLASCLLNGAASLWLYKKADNMRDRCDLATLPFCYRDAMAPAAYGIVITGVGFVLDGFWLMGAGGDLYQEAFRYHPFRVVVLLLGLFVNHFVLDQLRRGRARIKRACNRECDQCFEAAMGNKRRSRWASPT